MNDLTESSLGWTLAEAIKRTSDPDLPAAASGTAGALGRQMTAMWKRLSTGDLLATGCFDTPSGPPVAIDPKDFHTLNWAGPISTALCGVAGSEVRIFNVRVFSVLHAPNAPNRLNGLSLTEVFRRYIIGDPEIVSLSTKVLKGDPGHSPVFSEGQAPGPFVDFHWALETAAPALAFRFVDSPLMIIGDPIPTPSTAISAVSKVLADRIGALRDLLVSGRVVAFGTFAQTGVEGPIGRMQWTRSDISIDVRSGDLCEGQDYRAVPKWTGVDLRLPEVLMPANHAPNGPTEKIAEAATKAKGQIQTKRRSYVECVGWLESIMRASPETRTEAKRRLWARAQSKWPKKFGFRAFEAAWTEAVAKAEAPVWSTAGRPRKSTHP
jgi:hypothetical protein